MDREQFKSIWIIGLFAICFIQIALMLTITGSMNQKITLLQDDIHEIQSDFNTRLAAVTGKLETALTMQNSLVSDFSYRLEGQAGGQIHLSLNAILKSLPDGAVPTFQIMRDGKSYDLTKTTLKNNVITSEITFPLTETVEIFLFVRDKTQTQTENLGTINNVSSCLTDHLYLTPNLTVDNKKDNTLSGHYVFLNNKPSRPLDSIRLEMWNNNDIVHTFYFSQDSSNNKTANQPDVYTLTFNNVTTPEQPGNYTIRIVAEEETVKYECDAQTFTVNQNGNAESIQTKEDTFHISMLT